MDTTDRRRAVEAELRPGERIVWCGQPNPRRLAWQSLPLVLFGIPWTAFALFWMWGASAGAMKFDDGPSRVFPLFGLPFVLIGFGLLGSPIWGWRRALRTVYAITTGRVLILHVGARTLVEAYEAPGFDQLERTEGASGEGDLYFARERYRDRDGDARSRRIGFIGIPEVRRVEELLRKTLGPGPRV